MQSFFLSHFKGGDFCCFSNEKKGFFVDTIVDKIRAYSGVNNVIYMRLMSLVFILYFFSLFFI